MSCVVAAVRFDDVSCQPELAPVLFKSVSVSRTTAVGLSSMPVRSSGPKMSAVKSAQIITI